MPTNGEVLVAKGRQAEYQFVWTEAPKSGTAKDVYFAPDKSYVVAFYKKKPNRAGMDRLKDLVGRYREAIFTPQPEGKYWEGIFCWPTDIVDGPDGRIGLVSPAYPKNFFFAKKGQISANPMTGKEKVGKWFTSPVFRFGQLDPSEIGDWRRCFDTALVLARGMRRLHASGLAHSDLSYNNCLIDPSPRKAGDNIASSVSIIDLDGLVVPGKYPPDVIGTKGFVAPEVLETQSRPKNEQIQPSQLTDRHALAVLVYMYLLCRHPLDGAIVWDEDDDKHDESLTFGKNALFIEHPADRRNRYDWGWVMEDTNKKADLRHLRPWRDLDALPYTVLGPHLSKLVERAFVEGLHSPSKRPAAAEWEDALFKTLDLLVPCANPNCTMKWFIPEANPRGKCPFCGTAEPRPVAFVTLHEKDRKDGKYHQDRSVGRINLWHGASLHLWHARSLVQREKLSSNDLHPLGQFVKSSSSWIVHPLRKGLFAVDSGSWLEVGKPVSVQNGTKILLDGEGSRLAIVHLR